MNLNETMSFDHVIQVHYDGTVTEAPSGIYAPSILDEQLSDSGWHLLTGWSGQHAYSGPLMHDAEFIGGKLAAHILDTPGIYVALVAHWLPDSEVEDASEEFIEGWGIARLCRHSWTCGYMYVHEQDLITVAAVRVITCETCGITRGPSDPPRDWEVWG